MDEKINLTKIVSRYFQSILHNIEALEQFAVIDPVTQQDVHRQLAYIDTVYCGARQSIQQQDRYFRRAVTAFVRAHDAQEIQRMEEPLGYDWSRHKDLSWQALIVHKFNLFQAHL